MGPPGRAFSDSGRARLRMGRGGSAGENRCFQRAHHPPAGALCGSGPALSRLDRSGSAVRAGATGTGHQRAVASAPIFAECSPRPAIPVAVFKALAAGFSIGRRGLTARLGCVRPAGRAAVTQRGILAQQALLGARQGGKAAASGVAGTEGVIRTMGGSGSSRAIRPIGSILSIRDGVGRTGQRGTAAPPPPASRLWPHLRSPKVPRVRGCR